MVEQFARQHGDEVRVVGMGSQDNLELAGDFLAVTGVETPLMLWDRGFDSWAYYGVTGQPIAILVEPDGTPIQGWRGAFDPDEVLELAARA